MAMIGVAPSPIEVMAKLSPKIQESLSILTRELLRWNQTHNLTGHRTPEDVQTNLILDSLALVPHIQGPTLLDIGSGAGFPGLVLALAIPEISVTTLEPRAKRISFQKHMVRTLELVNRLRPIMARAGDHDFQSQAFATITIRALGSLSESLKLARPYLEPGGSILLPRGLKDKDLAIEMGLDVHEYLLPKASNPRIIVIARP